MKKCTLYEEQKGTRYIRGNVYFDIIVFSPLSSTKQCLRFLLVCFAWEIKCFYQSSLENEVDFREIMNVSPNILAKNQNFKKLRHGFLDERAVITTTLISSCHWKTLVTFYLWKKRAENEFLTLIIKKIEKQIMPSKTTINWLFNDLWCYLFIACFDWKNDVFQQKVVRVCYIFKQKLLC